MLAGYVELVETDCVSYRNACGRVMLSLSKHVRGIANMQTPLEIDASIPYDRIKSSL
jgi:hypothetical protein